MVDGQKLDTGKVRLDLIPPELVFGVGKVLTFGAKKYSERNWENGIAYGRVFGAALRHLFSWWKGERLDPETGYSHLWHAACCIAFLIAYEERGMVQWDDRPASKAAPLNIFQVGTTTALHPVPNEQCYPRPDGGGGAA